MFIPKKYGALTFILVSIVNTIAGEGIDVYEYYKMPLMHRQDDFERCLWSRKELSVYCTFHTLIKPDPTSELWKQIEDFSNDYKKNFAHDLIFAGLCLHECEAKLSRLTEEERENLYVEEFEWKLKRKWSYESWIHENTSEYRKMYDKTFNQCENLWLRENYNLSGYSTIQWCTTNQEFDYYKYDSLDYLFLIITALILIVVSSATILDSRLNSDDNLNHYKTEPKNLPNTQAYLLCFSIVRNWYRLTAPPNTELARDIRFLGPVRYLTILIIVLGHVLIGYFIAPGLNPEFVETISYGFGLSVGNWLHCVVQTFFVASGALVYISLKGILKQNHFNLKYIWAAIVYRYARLTPVYTYVLLFHATFLYKSGYGAYWKFFGETERSYCRQHGWTNLLYVNNYVHPNQQCMAHAWYLAADTQMFLIALLHLIFVFKYPQYRRKIMATAIFISCTIQFLVTYINGYPGIYLMPPEAKRFFLDNIQEEFETDYVTTHTNIGNYLIGLVLGMIYFRMKEKEDNLLRSKLFKILWHILTPVGFMLLSLIAYIFVNYDFETPSIWVSLVAVFTRNFWGIAGIIFSLGFMTSFKSPIKTFFHWPVLTTLSRLTFGIYLCHSAVTRILIGQPMYIGDFSIPLSLVQATAIFVMSNLVALVLCLTLEFPLTALGKQILRNQGNPTNEATNKKDDIMLNENNNLEQSTTLVV